MSDLDDLILKNYYGNFWRRKYPKKLDIECILDQIGCNKIYIKTDHKILIGANRIALYVSVEDITSNSRQRAYIDIISGMPSKQQYLDTTYGPGSYADLRIIIYDSAHFYRETASFYPKTYHEDIIELVSNNNRFGLITYLVLVESLGPGLFYTAIQGEPSEGIISIPPKRMVQEAFFWRHCFDYENCGYHLSEDPLSSFFDTTSVSLQFGGRRRLQRIWDYRGLHFNITHKAGSNWITNVWANKDVIQRAFPDCLIHLIEYNEKPQKIEIHFPFMIPMYRLLAESERTQFTWGECFRSMERTLIGIICPEQEDIW